MARYCARCPVASACLADGRRTHLSGIAGGYVLVDGRLALDTTPANAFRSAAAWTAPWELDEVDGDDCLPDQVVRLLTLARDGVTAGQAGAAITDGDEPTEPLTELGRRALVALEEAGYLRRDPALVGQDSRHARWRTIETDHGEDEGGRDGAGRA